jgi:hypothetical protein
MSERLNKQPTKELFLFQRFLLQSKLIGQLNKWLDEMAWENEKKDAIIEMKDNEIDQVKEQLHRMTQSRDQVEANFKKYMKSVKADKVDNEKMQKQQEIIKNLRSDLEAAQRRLKVSHRMNELLAKQTKN